MAETIHIAEMADRLSKELFSQFFWDKCGPTNQNWDCVSQEAHDVKSHPSDVVFSYDEPYEQRRTYVQCDLKSYAAKSITTRTITSALSSLAMQVECAEKSEKWQNLYTVPTVDFRVVGLLFIYCHNLDTDPDFNKKIQAIDPKKLKLSPGIRLYVLGPDDIYWINNVSNDIRGLRGDGAIPERSRCRFFYPQLVRKMNYNLRAAKAATLDMLSSPWVIMEHDRSDGRRGITIYHKRAVEDPRELVYLIDYIRNFQLLVPEVSISVRALASNDSVFENFHKAKRIYIDKIIKPNQLAHDSSSESIVDLVNKIDVTSFQNVARTFALKELASREN
ncbi:hypothetical protein [Xanthobacter flavus]|uniref:hypothetical protein n=1 Tax=Xanthobacter flavus TaxID=281 RepID=UPI003729B81E